MPLKITYLLSTSVSISTVYLLSENVEFGEALRPDEYSMGTLYYVLLFLAAIVSSALVVMFTQYSKPIETKFRVWLKANFISIIVIILGVLGFALLYGIAMSTSHWSFG